ncbi:MAG: iron-only hydrogenase system regulator [Clostridia bacterium]|nr:iron-only hydrogenase system regulator [Clostridia bacterium]
MQNRVALIGIIIENTDSIERLNHILSEYSQHIIGRMGIPYHEKGINIISITVDAPQNVTSALSGKIGSLQGITAKTIYASDKK